MILEEAINKLTFTLNLCDTGDNQLLKKELITVIEQLQEIDYIQELVSNITEEVSFASFNYEDIKFCIEAFKATNPSSGDGVLGSIFGYEFLITKKPGFDLSDFVDLNDKLKGLSEKSLEELWEKINIYLEIEPCLNSDIEVLKLIGLLPDWYE